MKEIEAIHTFDKNLLPKDGTAFYCGDFLTKQKSDMYFHQLLNETLWATDELVIFGKKIITKRETAWYGDHDISYTYSNATKIAIPWTKTLFELKTIVEEVTQNSFNSCLLNLYHDGNEGIAWHSDDEPELEKYGMIASLTFGAERRFVFKHKTEKIKTEILLEHGSLLVMQGKTQESWLHSLPKSKKIKLPRINLTFRKINTI